MRGVRSGRRSIGGLFGFLALLIFALATQASPQAINVGNRILLPPVPSPSLYPAFSPPATSSPYPGGGQYFVATPTAVSTPSSGNFMLVGGLVARTCNIVAAIPDTGAATPGPSITVTLPPDQEVCTTNTSGDTPALTIAPNPSGAGYTVPSAFSKYSINGVVYQLNQNLEQAQYRIQRQDGVQYTASASGNGHNYAFYIQAWAQAQAVAAEAKPIRPVSNFLGTFAGEGGGAAPPNGMFSATAATGQPSPYPTPNGGSPLFGSTGLCDRVTTSGYSITSAHPLDYNAMSDIVGLGAQWTRTGAASFFDDHTHIDGNTGYIWSTLDALQCGLLRQTNPIIPEIEIDPGPVYYGNYPNYVSNAIYKNPQDMATWCSAVAQHEQAYFPQVTTFSMLGSEYNGGFQASDVTNTSPLQTTGLGSYYTYEKGCYQAIKAVNPNYIVAFGQINLDPGASPLAMIQYGYSTGVCRIGLCYDLFNIHPSFGNVVSANYPSGETGQQPSDTENIGLLDYYIQQIASFGETRPVYFEFGESAYYPTTPSTLGGFVASLGGQAYYHAAFLNAIEQRPYVWRDIISNVDSNCQYIGTAFANAGVMTSPSCSPPPIVSSPNPAYYAIQPFAQVSPGPGPTLVPGTAPTPTPTSTPSAAPTLAPTSGPFAWNQVSQFNYGGAPSLTTAPANGTVVLGFGLAGGLGTMHDSNGIAYTSQEAPQNGDGTVAQLFDGISGGSAGTAYTFSIGGGGASTVLQATNVSAYPGTYFGGTTTETGSYSVSITGVNVGDGLACAIVSNATITAFTINDGTNTAIANAGSNKQGVYSIATTSGTATATATFATSGYTVSLSCVDYK